MCKAGSRGGHSASGHHQAVTRERSRHACTRRRETLAAGSRRTDAPRHQQAATMHPPAIIRMAAAGAKCCLRYRAARMPMRATRTANQQPASACRRGSAPAPSPGRRTDCAGSFITLLRHYRTQTRCGLPASTLVRSMLQLIARGNSPLTVCRRDGTGVAKSDSDRDRWSMDCERPRPPREEVLDAATQRSATAGRRRRPAHAHLRRLPGVPRRNVNAAAHLPRFTPRPPCLDSSPTCR